MYICSITLLPCKLCCPIFPKYQGTKLYSTDTITLQFNNDLNEWNMKSNISFLMFFHKKSPTLQSSYNPGHKILPSNNISLETKLLTQKWINDITVTTLNMDLKLHKYHHTDSVYNLGYVKTGFLLSFALWR